jgi:CBS domain-containing protein
MTRLTADLPLKDQPISRLMESRTHTLPADHTVQEVEAFMTNHHLHWAPVVGDRGELLGVISEVDLVRFRHEKRDPLVTKAWQLCTFRPLTVSPETSVAEVARLMVGAGVHHVVVGEGGAVLGVVSSMDFVRLLA